MNFVLRVGGVFMHRSWAFGFDFVGFDAGFVD
jgi:hypothetical protein